MSIAHLFHDRTNIFGSIATGTSAASAVIQNDEFLKASLACLSVIVGVLTIVHLVLQIRVLALAWAEEKNQ